MYNIYVKFFKNIKFKKKINKALFSLHNVFDKLTSHFD